MSKILILSERLPFPPNSGTKNLLYNYCRILYFKLGLEVVSVSFLEDDDDKNIEKPEFINKVYKLPNPIGKSKIKNLLMQTFIKKKFPMQVSLFWDPKIKEKIDEIIEQEKPQIVIADLVRCAEYLKDFNGLRILDMQDLFSLRYERQLQMDLESLNPYGAYLYRLSKFVQSILSKKSIKKLVMSQEIKLLKKYEEEISDSYDRIMFVAKSEGEIYNKRIHSNKSLIVPLGVDYEYFSEKLNVNKIPHSIAFMGALNVAHNENGILHFIKNIFPEVKQNIKDAKLYIIGGGATDNIKKYADNQSVILTGRVPDVREAVGACEIFICPLQFGSGIKTKNLEAMAMGLPVVTTIIGAENIDGENKKDWFVASSDSEFAKNVCTLMENTNLRKYIGENGQNYVKNEFSWSLAEKSLKEVLNK